MHLRTRSLLAFALAFASAPTSACRLPPPGEQEPQEPQVQRPRNRLGDETSPYLRQHAHNPVDWYPWGPEALQRAKALDRPIFLSIGYSACHWCHVMERESFEDEATAQLLNDNFVCIKVDREERPDLDEIYMAAVQVMTGQGGWPMSVWLTPDLEPFFGGTYFPPEDAHGRPGFPRVLTQLARAWRERRAECVAGGKQLAGHLQQALQAHSGGHQLPDDAAATMAAQSAERHDDEYGGFASAPQFAPKFPHAAELSVLLRLAAAGDAAARAIALRTLDRMAAGGIHDQIGGGFHRYSTDRQWLVPHFEKMLYDNAQLVATYLEAFQLTGDVAYAEVARRTLDYLLRELRGPDGGFYSSQDADSEGEEGVFFTWSRAEFDALLGDDAALAAAHFGVTAAGNWEGRNVLAVAQPIAALARQSAGDETAIGARLARAREQLFAARGRRVRPATDDKVLTAWNAMAISACALGHQVLGDERYLQAARGAAEFALQRLRVDGRLLRSWHSGRARHAAYLEDHAFLGDALLTLFESDADPRWLAEAQALLQTTIDRFRDPADGSFFFTADDHEQLIARSKSAMESSVPSGVAVLARAGLRAGLLLGDEQLYAVGVRALEAHAALLMRTPIASPSLVLAWQFHRADPREIVVAGATDDPATGVLLRRLRARFPADHVLARIGDDNRAALAKLSKVFDGKLPIGGRPAVYVCRRGACAAPITDPEQLR